MIGVDILAYVFNERTKIIILNKKYYFKDHLTCGLEKKNCHLLYIFRKVKFNDSRTNVSIRKNIWLSHLWPNKKFLKEKCIWLMLLVTTERKDRKEGKFSEQNWKRKTIFYIAIIIMIIMNCNYESKTLNQKNIPYDLG